jgi:hypothetical protein
MTSLDPRLLGKLEESRKFLSCLSKRIQYYNLTETIHPGGLGFTISWKNENETIAIIQMWLTETSHISRIITYIYPNGEKSIHETNVCSSFVVITKKTSRPDGSYESDITVTETDGITPIGNLKVIHDSDGKNHHIFDGISDEK